MPFYENVFVARQDVSTQQVEALVAQFSELVQANGGEVKKTEMWGLKSLSFRVKKNRKGHYVLLNLDAPPVAVQELERNLRINEDVLRYLTIRVDALEEGPSAMLQSRSRDDRPRRDGDRPDRGDRDRGDRDRGDRGDRPDRGDRERSRSREDEAPAAPAAPATGGES